MAIPIVFSTDENFVMQTGVSIYSLIHSKNKEDSYRIIILVDKDLSDSSRKNISELVANTNCTIEFLQIDNTFDGVYETRGISKASYFRLLIPWLLTDCNRVIYSDGDIIFQGSLYEAYSYDLSDNYICGVKSVGALLYKQQNKYITNLGLNPQNYINAGFLLINAAKMREDNLNIQIYKHIKKKYLYQDQDILNLICKDKISYLPLKYNFPALQYYQAKKKNKILQYGLIDNNEEGELAIVIHYIGPKPWNVPTFLSLKWWNWYRKTTFYRFDYEMRFYEKINNPQISFKQLIKYTLSFLRIK